MPPVLRPRTFWLAQQSQSADPIPIVLTVAALIIAVVLAGLAVMHIRARLLRKQDDRATTESWLDELRSMHRRGEVSDEEFQAARASLLAKVTGAPVPRPPTPADPTARIARPGFDLTGAPLPTPGGPIAERPPGPGPGPPPAPSTDPDR